MDRFLIVGLGNPGPEYADTRHNIGFMCADELARAHGLTFSRRQSKALVADGRIAGRKALLAKPQTFMNLSGQSVAGLTRFYQVPLERVMVIFDDLDLPLGVIRLRKEGGAGGHKGMRDIIERLGSDAFPRLRVGIGRPPGRMDPAAYVLRPFDADEQPVVEQVRERAVRALETWLAEGIEMAMSRHNGPSDDAPATSAPATSAPATGAPAQEVGAAE